MTLTVGSLCAGAGMLDLALASLLDIRQAWHAEVDSAASKVLAAHFSGASNHGDITNPLDSGPYGLPRCRWTAPRRKRQAAKRHDRRMDAWRRMAEPVDIMCAGWPCQPFSGAGKQRGSNDERHLWPIGVLPAIEALRPRLFVGENVPRLLTIERGQIFGQIVGDLDRLGYAVSWTVVGACRVGACHHRHRLFLAAVPAELVADTDRPEFPPSSWRTPTGWQPTAGTLFGETSVSWPQAGLVVDGHAWPLPADPCGATGTVLPTPTATPYGNNQSPSDGAAVRPSLDGVVRMLPTPRVAAVRTGRSAVLGSSSSPSLEQALEIAEGVLPRELASWDEAPASWVPLPTPTARIADKRGTPSPETARQRMDDGRRNLEDAVALLPTPRTSDVHGAGQHGDGGLDLRTAVSLLPTPTARDATRGAGWGDQTGRPLSEVIALLPTPVATDADGGPGRRNTHGKPMLPGAVGALLPTPTASDATKDGPGARGSKGGPQLPGAIHLMPTPRASDAAKGGPNQRGSSGDLMLPAAVQPGRFGVYEPAVRRQETAFSLPAPEPTEPGRLGKPRLAPAFPEWMVGLRRGWITDHVGRNDAIRIAGNGVVWQAAAFALPLLPTFRAFVASLTGAAAGGAR